MINFKMFEMQISTHADNHNLRKNVGTNKKYILKKMTKVSKP